MTNLPEIIDSISELVALPSVSSVRPELDQSNLTVIQRLADWSRALGFRCEVLAVDDAPGHYNLVATLGGDASSADGLILAGHTDTVPCNPGLWSSDPWRAVEKDDRLYGLGTADMKAFLALALEAVRRMDLSGPCGRLRRPLTLLATADEESSMRGARALVRAGRPRAGCAIIGEPTGLRPVRMHKGMLMESVRVHGQAGHSSDPSLGRNALEGMHIVLGELLRWRTELQDRYRDPMFAVPVATLNPGSIHGGDNPNRICGDCELQFDLRLLPGMDHRALREELHQRLRAVLAGGDLTLEFVTLMDPVPTLQTAATAAIVQATEALTGHPAEAVAFGTEAPFLAQLGIDTVVLGPGDIDQAHQPDEFLSLDRIEPTVTLLQGLIRRFCCDR